MKYAIIAICILSGLCVCYIGRTYYERGRADCEKAQSIAAKHADDNARRIQTDVTRTVVHTATADIRRLLREKYTIAD